MYLNSGRQPLTRGWCCARPTSVSIRSRTSLIIESAQGRTGFRSWAVVLCWSLMRSKTFRKMIVGRWERDHAILLNQTGFRIDWSLETWGQDCTAAQRDAPSNIQDQPEAVSVSSNRIPQTDVTLQYPRGVQESRVTMRTRLNRVQGSLVEVGAGTSTWFEKSSSNSWPCRTFDWSNLCSTFYPFI